MTTTTTAYAVSVGVADIRRHPDSTSELVTQALMNVAAIADEIAGEWTHVTLSDYKGWIRSEQLEEPVAKGLWDLKKLPDETGEAPLTLMAVITDTHSPLYAHAQDDHRLGTVYLSTA